MKKIFSFYCLLAFINTASAQPSSGIAPNFTLKDLNGQWHTLYNYLDAGKTVFIDFSAAWCQPCWNFHNTHTFETLYQQHGPAGYPGVNANTTDDVMVFFIEGEPNNTTAQLYGTAGTGPDQATQGNWITGISYPIIDTNAATTNALLNAWGVTGYPTLIMICRDRLAYKFQQLSASMFYSAAQYGCPSYPPSATFDAKIMPYIDQDYFYCNPDPEIRFQNYSKTQAITNATINFYNNTNLVHSYSWTGNVLPYGVAKVSVPPFAAGPYSGYKFEVVVSGDSQPSNNKSSDSMFWVYSAANAVPIPYAADFDFSPLFPYKFRASSYRVETSSGTVNVTPIVYLKGANGQNTRAARFRNRYMWWYETAELIIGNYNTSTIANPTLEFDVAYAQYNGNENDTLEVLASTDCGNTWNSVWLKSGSTLATSPAVGNFTDFYPQSATHWRHETVNLNAYKSPNTILLFRNHCNMGNDMWVDNIKLHSTTSVDNIAFDERFRVFPNPAKDRITLSYTTSHTGDAQIRVTDVLGRPVHSADNIKTQAGENSIQVQLPQLNGGVYFVTLVTAGAKMNSSFIVER